jgi:hypothetical protein
MCGRYLQAAGGQAPPAPIQYGPGAGFRKIGSPTAIILDLHKPRALCTVKWETDEDSNREDVSESTVEEGRREGRTSAALG